MKNFVILISIIISSFLLLIGCSSTLDESTLTSKNSNVSLSNKSPQEETHIATIYTLDSQAEGLIDKEVNVNILTPDSLFNELKNINIIPQGTELNSFDIYSKNNTSIGVINFSKDFYNFNLGSSGEILMLNSIAKTYLENLNLDKLKILVDGEEYQSGHILYEEDDFFTLDSIN